MKGKYVICTWTKAADIGDYMKQIQEMLPAGAKILHVEPYQTDGYQVWYAEHPVEESNLPHPELESGCLPEDRAGSCMTTTDYAR